MTDRTLEGERRHETCRYGIFARKAFRIEKSGTQTPIAMPLCGFKIPEGLPPAVYRKWGGDIELARDCALCPAHEEL